MKKALLLAVALCAGVLCAGTAFGQPTRKAVIHSTPADSKPNSPEVPEVYAVSTRFERVAILRLKHKTDLLAGLQKIVREQKIHNGVFLSAIGSVRSYHVHAVTNRDFPVEDTFIQDAKGAADIIGFTGYVIGGKVHAHMTMAAGTKAFGGHLEPGTEVFTFAVITVGVLPVDVDLSKVDDITYR